MNNLPLRYRISSWRQLPDCISNSSTDIKIHLTDFYNNVSLRGMRISVDHITFGTLFACILNARGEIIYDEDSSTVTEDISTERILQELKKFGFLIEYKPNTVVGSKQLEYLIVLNKLNYDKIRLLPVTDTDNCGVKTGKIYVVAFQADKHPKWLDDAYVCTESEFEEALKNSTAINITYMSETHNFRWDWLTTVQSIEDIIRVNADDMI